MRPINISERKKKIFEFAGLYAGSLCLLLIIFQALLPVPTASGVSEIPETTPASISRQNREALTTDGVLHQRLELIQSMDKIYASLLLTGAGIQKIDSLRRAIKDAEQILKIQVDSAVSRHANGNWSDSLLQNIKAFQSDLDNRQTQEDIRETLMNSKIPGIHDNQSNTLELKEAILNKDIRITDLEAEIRSLKNTKSGDVNTLASVTGQKSGDADLKKNYEDLQKNYKILTETNSHLRVVTDNLTSQIASADPVSQDNTSSIKTKTTALEHKINDLNAELYFSTVDCNLSRVDVNQIISNSKQRRALLKQTMDLLTSLKNSDNPETQQRAEQKIQQISKIISTVRD